MKNFLYQLSFIIFLFTISNQASAQMMPGHGTINDKPGLAIYDHQVTSASSNDGLHWQADGKVLFDHASVPDAVITTDKTIYLYFMDATDQGHKMTVAISKDLGNTWQKQDVSITGRQEAGAAVDPNPMQLSDGSIRLFYLGSFRTPPTPGKPLVHSIYSALSQDGIHFQEEPGARLSYDHVTDPDVIKTDKGWKMFVSQEGRTDLSASSQDGMSFTLDNQPASREGAISRTIAIDGGYRLFKCRQGIEAQFTTDFITWRDEGVALSPKMGLGYCDPGVIKMPDGTYKMYFKQMPVLHPRDQR